MEKPMNSPPPYQPGFNNPGYSQSHQPSGPQAMSVDFKMNYSPAPTAPPQHTVVHHMQPAPPTHTTVVVSGGAGLPGCPVCHNNSWGSSWGCCAWMWLICCFPLGIVCCLCMRRKKCTQCGYTAETVHVMMNNPVGCPSCRNNSWTGTYSLCAWLLCIFCFPCGLICCCCMRKKKCSKCGYTVG